MCSSIIGFYIVIRERKYAGTMDYSFTFCIIVYFLPKYMVHFIVLAPSLISFLLSSFVRILWMSYIISEFCNLKILDAYGFFASHTCSLLRMFLKGAVKRYAVSLTLRNLRNQGLVPSSAKLDTNTSGQYCIST